MNVAQPLIQASLIGEAIDAGPVLVFVADEDMNYVAVNEYACSRLGYTREELLQRNVTDLAPQPETPETFARFVRQRRMGGTTAVRHKDGRVLPLVYRASETTVAGMTLYVSVGWLEDEQP